MLTSDISKIMDELNWTPTQWSALIGMTRQQLSNILNRKTIYVHQGSVDRIKEGLKSIDRIDLLGAIEELERNKKNKIITPEKGNQKPKPQKGEEPMITILHEDEEVIKYHTKEGVHYQYWKKKHITWIEGVDEAGNIVWVEIKAPPK